MSASNPLPTTATITGGGDASAANQVTGNASLATLVTQTDALEASVGATNETSAAADNSTSGLNGLFKRLLARFTLFLNTVRLEYETVAASQTAVALGATGATGDYLSHVVIQPTTTSPGTVTILDNATVIFTFTTTTLGDLRPITVPFGALSTSGAWKVTTGANVTATAFGDFT